MEREAPLFLEARTWKVLETILDRKSSPTLNKFLVKASKIDPKTSPNRAQDVPKSRSGGDSVANRVSIPNRSPNYPLLGVSWGVLGASCARLGAVLELSWGVLGRLGSVLRASWGVLGAPWGAFVVLVVFLLDFDGFLIGKWMQIGTHS